MSQLLEVVKVNNGSSELMGMKFRSVRMLSKYMEENDDVVVFELNGTKDAVNSKVGYRTVRKAENGKAVYTRPSSSLEV